VHHGQCAPGRPGPEAEEQDRLALESHQRAHAAIENKSIADEIVPVAVAQRKGDPLIFNVDERPMETTMEKLGKLKPFFDGEGTVTAGNASGISDGACALVLMAADKAKL
jgi:acetyl-CoA C-acetyltransferase